MSTNGSKLGVEVRLEQLRRVFAGVVALTAAHSLLVGPRLLSLEEMTLPGASRSDETLVAELRSLRLRSIALSGASLFLSLTVLFCTVLLQTAFAQGGV